MRKGFLISTFTRELELIIMNKLKVLGLFYGRENYRLFYYPKYIIIMSHKMGTIISTIEKYELP